MSMKKLILCGLHSLYGIKDISNNTDKNNLIKLNAAVK